MKRIARVLGPALVLAAVACATLGRHAFRQPSFALHSVRVMGLGVTGGSLEVDLNVYNPNEYRLDATNLTYQVTIDSTPLAGGAITNRISVRQQDSVLVKIPVTFTYAGLGAAGRSILNTGVLTYHVNGSVDVQTAVGTFTVPFAQTGRFNSMGVAIH